MGSTGKFGKGPQAVLDNWADAHYDTITEGIRSHFAQALSILPQLLEDELSAIRAAGGRGSSALEDHQRELNYRNTLIAQKLAEEAAQTLLANAFYGSDPLGKTPFDFVRQWRPGTPLSHIKDAWTNAYTAAYNAQLLAAGSQALSAQANQLAAAIAALEAQEAERAAAQAHAAAEQAAAEARARNLAEEEARRKAEADGVAAEAQAEADRAATLGAASTIPTPFLNGARVVPVLNAAGGVLTAAVRSAIAALGSAAASVASGLAVGVGALVYSSKIGNGELPEHYGVSLPLADLASYSEADLTSVAAAGGTVELPYRIDARSTPDGQTELFVVATGAADIPTQVQVVSGTYDSNQNAYTATIPTVPPTTLTWTPIVIPTSSSTALPAEHPELPVYAGTSATPVVVQIETLPGVSITVKDLIIVHPADSGLPPIYIALNSPYPGATVKGAYSGRYYNPEKAGGATLNLDWSNAVITAEGVELVKLHTGRFGYSAENEVMIDRLARILSGEIPPTDTDKRYYTHELRELERYRELGVADGTTPDDDEKSSEVWNNAHTGALEDYKIKDDVNLLYTPEALKSVNKKTAN